MEPRLKYIGAQAPIHYIGAHQKVFFKNICNFGSSLKTVSEHNLAQIRSIESHWTICVIAKNISMCEFILKTKQFDGLKYIAEFPTVTGATDPTEIPRSCGHQHDVTQHKSSRRTDRTSHWSYRKQKGGKGKLIITGPRCSVQTISKLHLWQTLNFICDIVATSPSPPQSWTSPTKEFA